MRKLLILLLFPFYLYSNSIAFEELEKKALENSFHLQELDESIKMDENRLKELKYPGQLNLRSSFSPTYTFITNNSEYNDFDWGSLGLSFTPYHSIDFSTKFNEDSTDFSVSYMPLKSNREIDKLKNQIDINKIKFSENRNDFYKNLKVTYTSLYFKREKLDLTRNYLDLLNKKITQEENKLDKGLGSSETVHNHFKDLLDTESNIYNLEIDILKLESEIFKMSGIDIKNLKMNPLFTELKLDNEAIIKTLDEYMSKSDYLFLEEGIRDQKVAITDSKKGILPDLSISVGANTKDYSNFTGYISLSGSLSIDFNYLTKIENEQLKLNSLERAKVQKIKEYNQEIEYSKRTIEINRNRIDSLTRNLNRSNKNLEAQKFRLNKGEILTEDYKYTEIQNKQLQLDLNEAKTLFILEYMTKY